MPLPVQYEYVTNAERLGHIAREIEQAEVLALDLETTAFSPREGKIRLFSVNTGKGVYVVDLFQTQTCKPLLDALTVCPGVIVGQNLKFEQKWLLYHFAFEFVRIFDTYRASAIIYNGIPGLDHDLWSLYRRELKIEPQTEDLGGSNWSQPVLTQEQKDYAAEDVIHLPRIREVLKPKLAQKGLNRIALIEFEAILPEAAIELNGFYLNPQKWTTLARENEVNAKRLRDELLFELPNPSNQLALPGFAPSFNLDSPDQMLRSLRMMGLSKLENTQEITLAMFASAYPIINKILEYRGYAQRVKTFGEDYLKHVNRHTGRVHTEFFAFTGAGRYASSKPNLQNIPRTADYRSCFQAEEGNTLTIADFSNIEMRIVAEISGDPVLTKVFCEHRCAHYATASLLAGIPLEQVTKPQRQQAKPVNFGFIYGMQPPKLVLYAKANYGVTLTLEQATQFREAFFKGYAVIAKWHEKVQREAKKNKCARTLWGRWRFLDPETAYNEFFNTPVQGTGADGLKRALPIVYRRMKKLDSRVKMVHMVHDEIITEHPEDKELTVEVQRNLREGMIEGIQPMLLKVPVEAEPGSGPTWASKS